MGSSGGQLELLLANDPQDDLTQQEPQGTYSDVARVRLARDSRGIAELDP